MRGTLDGIEHHERILIRIERLVQKARISNAGHVVLRLIARRKAAGIFHWAKKGWWGARVGPRDARAS